MALRFRHLLIAALLGGLVASALPAAAAQVGDAFGLGIINSVNARSSLRGNVDTTNLQIRNTGSGIPLTLKTGGSGRPPLAVDSRGKVRNLNADLLDSRHANGLIRAAFGSVNEAPNQNGPVVSASISAPQAGVLVMGGSVGAFGNAADIYTCVLAVDGQQVAGSKRIPIVHNPGSGHTANNREGCATDGGMFVAKGSHTVTLEIENLGTADLKAASVWVIWAPFDGMGKVPTP